MALLVEAMVYISTNNSREIYMSVLDPYGKMNNDPSWIPGVSGTVAQNGAYIEDTGKGCLLYTSPSPRDGLLSRMPSSS